mgnify:CR=1 FL=1
MKIEKFYLDDGTFIRFKKIGNGTPILLLHTFRNRLEYSDKLGKLLEDKFTVYSIDLPGFGDSPINTSTNYNLDFFTKSIVSFIKKLRMKNLTIAGESIGATLAASVSVELPKVVKKILMFNTYDYDSYFGEGIQRGNFFAKFILFHVSLPVVGVLFSSLENKFILKNIMSGGFFDKTKLPDSYLNLLCTSLKKKGYVNKWSLTDSKNRYDSLYILLFALQRKKYKIIQIGANDGEKADPIKPAIIAKIRYMVPISLWLVE